MITKIRIQNFKSLEDVTLECSNLNVLTGLNGMGKSSVIQTLLLLKQSFESGYMVHDGLMLNGDLVTIGSGKEALYEFAKEEAISFNLEFKIDNKFFEESWAYVYEKNNGEKDSEERKFMDSDYLPYSDEFRKVKNSLNNYNFFKRDTFKYLNAERLVKNEYDVSDAYVVRKRSLGKHGEYTAHFLNHYEYEEINPELLYDGVETNQLLIQVSAWLNDISPKTKVIPQRVPGANSIKLRFQFEGIGSTKELSPLNVGFGITYTLPILVALLSSKPGDVLILENPEAHLHPGGQAMIGRLIAKVANSGVQIFLETHSDHIINGILVSIYRENKGIEKGIRSDNVRINFIEREMDKMSSKVELINVRENGRIIGVPDGFFDQYSKDMKIIIGF